MKYFLDTNVIIDAIKGKNKNIIKHFESTFSSEIYISSIVVAELEYGAFHSSDYKRNKSLYEQFIKDFTIVPFTKEYCPFYAQIRQSLTSTGKIIGSNDILIASTAIANDAVMVTHNIGEFERIPNIKLEDWTL